MDVNSFVIGYTKGKQSAVGSGGSPAGFHMVRFFNDDRTTLLYTVFVPTGASAIYAGETPTSAIDSAMVLAGFEPSPANVTEDMDCFAVYEYVITTLDAATWDQISQLSANGKAQNYFAVGDTKIIHIEGTVGTLNVNGDYGVFILGFNHNPILEGTGIHFGTFKSALSGGKDIAFVDSKYTAKLADGTKCFNMNHRGAYSYGGWSACDLRYDILGSTDKEPLGYGSAKTASSVGYDASETCATNPVENTLMAALPADLRAVMKPMTKFTDNIGNGTDVEGNITATLDYLPLPSPTEEGGIGTENSKEYLYAKTYDYYLSGSSAAKYLHNDTSKISRHWNRSPDRMGKGYFIALETSASSWSSNNSLAIAPIFKV